MTKGYRICTRCVMDTTDPEITFDINGVCNHCRNYENVSSKTFLSGDEANEKLHLLVEEIRASGKNKEYDCIMGLSGGIDSSYLMDLAIKLGLRPYVTHLDNGWNSEISIDNIKRISEQLGIVVDSYKINFDEFCDVQRSFLKASVIDIELITDNAILAHLIKSAKKLKIKYILRGSNNATESGIPRTWSWFKWDATNIMAIHRKFGTRQIETLPTFGTWQWFWNRYTKQISFVTPLDYVGYKKSEAIKVLSEKFGLRDYGGKHYESVFTKFYQTYILPQKFGVDKRKAHFSSLIRNGEMTRHESMEILKKPPYDSEELVRDKQYVLNELGFSEEEFEKIMNIPPRSHDYYFSDMWIMKYISRSVYFTKRIFDK
jgi:N-acetyl sugar amidotransferase